MLSKRNLTMIMTMILVVLVLFLSSVVLKEYFNDYDVNHAAENEPIARKDASSQGEGGKEEASDASASERLVLYIGAGNNGYYRAMKEWAGYRKKSFHVFSSLDAVDEKIQTKGKQKTYLLMDGELLGENTVEAVKKLSRYVEQGGVVVFYRLPSYQTIADNWNLQELLGIQHLRGESVKLQEIRLYGGFLLGGETHYSFENVEEPELADMELSLIHI